MKNTPGKVCLKLAYIVEGFTMWCQRKICVALIALLLPMSVQAQETETDTGALHLELNGVQDVGGLAG